VRQLCKGRKIIAHGVSPCLQRACIGGFSRLPPPQAGLASAFTPRAGAGERLLFLYPFFSARLSGLAFFGGFGPAPAGRLRRYLGVNAEAKPRFAGGRPVKRASTTSPLGLVRNVDFAADKLYDGGGAE